MDGYMVRTSAARETGYSDAEDVGAACDFDFGCRLAQCGDFFFVGSYTAAYRLSDASVSSGGFRVLVSKGHFLTVKLSLPEELQDLRRSKLQRMASVSVCGCLLAGERAKALNILFSPFYVWRRQPIKALVQLALVFAPTGLSRRVIERKRSPAPVSAGSR
jgi:hypothetical protein